MLRLDRPDIYWAGLARSFGLESRRSTTIDAFNDAFAAALSGPGPFLIEVLIDT